MRYFLTFFAPLVLSCADPALLDRVGQYLKQTSDMTGFAIRRQVPAAMISRAELDRYLNTKMRNDVNPRKMELEELTLKLFGFAPPDFDLRKTTLDLLGEQAAAFYDFKARKLYVLDHVSDTLGPELLIHELGHALADQRYGLRKFLSRAGNDDAALARMAVMEGQAMWLMGEYAARQAGASLRESPEIARRFAQAEADEDATHPVMQNVPLYLKESLLFPYSHGLRFQVAVCEKHADCLSRVFEKPPASSAQVMHPHLYFNQVQPESIPPPAAPKGWRKLHSGALGEIDLSILLRTFQLSPRDITPAWRGGAYAVYQHKRSRNYLLTHSSIWEEESAATRWLAAYASLLAARFPSLAVLRQEPDHFEATANGARYLIRRTGRAVQAFQGLPLN